MLDNTNKELTMKKKFSIEEDIQTFKMVIKEFPSEILTQIDIKPNSAILLINDSVFREISDHIEWGNLNTYSNIREQGGLLIGRVYNDDKLHITYGVVEKILFSNPTSSSSASLEMGHTTWQNMLREYDNYRIKNSKNHIIGWYHTHPNNLDVFMSGVDMNTQKNFFNKDWHFAIVLNPHRKIWKVFNGKDATECLGIEYDKEYNNIVLNSNKFKHNSNPKVFEHKEEEEVNPLFIKQLFIFSIIGIIFLFFFLYNNEETTINSDKNKSKKNFIKVNYVKKLNTEDNITETNYSSKIKNQKGTSFIENKLIEMNSNKKDITESNYSSKISYSNSKVYNESNNSKIVLIDNTTMLIQDNKLYIKENIFKIKRKYIKNKTKYTIKLKNIPFYIDFNKDDCKSIYSKYKCYNIGH